MSVSQNPEFRLLLAVSFSLQKRSLEPDMKYRFEMVEFSFCVYSNGF